MELPLQTIYGMDDHDVMVGHSYGLLILANHVR